MTWRPVHPPSSSDKAVLAPAPPKVRPPAKLLNARVTPTPPPPPKPKFRQVMPQPAVRSAPATRKVMPPPPLPKDVPPPGVQAWVQPPPPPPSAEHAPHTPLKVAEYSLVLFSFLSHCNRALHICMPIDMHMHSENVQESQLCVHQGANSSVCV